ncbi:MAG: hypothetical protein CO128_08855 [Ignavibacteriales bacterium CG_4_9_14_3_um_filter_30_11]|nr:MAG: hypothetical protein CO128_08855 [Ignavibacteriales bacterium CG_4_9_14_3_um_filter_30_11]
MNFQKNKNYPLLLSLLLHIIFFLIFIIIKINVDYPNKEFVDVIFGLTGKSGSPGIKGTEIENNKKYLNENISKTKTYNKIKEKKVVLPKSKTENNVLPNKFYTKNLTNTIVVKEKTDKDVPTKNGNKGKEDIGKNNLGYDIDWGGRGQRRIYSFSLPEYPEGVNKEIDIRLKFTILPDGTVGSIFPLIKADTQLEDAAIKSLRQWRFEPLSENQNKINQTAVIIFPYRLK